MTVNLGLIAENGTQTFLLRHVYASTMDGLQLSRTSATFITFLLSACCHELVMAVVSKKIRPYLFLMQVSHSPYLPTLLSETRSLSAVRRELMRGRWFNYL